MTATGQSETRDSVNCLAYVPNNYNGVGGTTQTLIWILERFEPAGIHPFVCFERTWKFPRDVPSISLFPWIFSRLPGRWTALIPKYFMERAFLRRLSRHSPSDTFVYIWPQPRLALIKAIKAQGFCVFREMINCPGNVYIGEVGIARRNAGLAPWESNDDAIETELQHLRICDFVTAPNAAVEQALLKLGLPPSKIVPTSFGWAEDRFPGWPKGAGKAAQQEDRPFTALFVGHLDARKGIHYLLEAWEAMPPEMRLQLVGTVNPEMAPILERAQADERIAHLPFTADLEPIFRSADVFALPTVEEGGPQVTIEAAGCGLPVITTPMGAARLISDGRNGLIVPPHDVPALRTALLDLYQHPQKRAALAHQAQLDAKAFTYECVGAARAAVFRQKFTDYQITRRSR